MQELIFVDVSSEDESLEAFLNLLPAGYEEGKNRKLIGCCDKEGLPGVIGPRISGRVL